MFSRIPIRLAQIRPIHSTSSAMARVYVRVIGPFDVTFPRYFAFRSGGAKGRVYAYKADQGRLPWFYHDRFVSRRVVQAKV